MIRNSKLIFNLANKLKPKVPLEKLAFGNSFTDHILTIDWTKKDGWDKPVIQQYQNLELLPAISSLHYGFSVFEGMKAYKDSNNQIRLFRPMENIKRLSSSAKALSMPHNFKNEELLKCIYSLLYVDRDWIPNEPGYSMYIRPMLFSTDPDLSVRVPESCKLVTMLSPVGPYYKNGFKPISLLAETKKRRSFMGGTGCFKVAGNYAPTLQTQSKALEKGHSQVLWINDGEVDDDYIPIDHVAEAGTMNVFFLVNTGINIGSKWKLYTPKLDDTILPGVTRDSVIEIVKKEYPEIEILERNYEVWKMKQDILEGNVQECFGTGTAAVISPINAIELHGELLQIKNTQKFNLAEKLYDRLTGIQYGEQEDPYDWSVILHDQ